MNEALAYKLKHFGLKKQTKKNSIKEGNVDGPSVFILNLVPITLTLKHQTED